MITLLIKSWTSAVLRVTRLWVLLTPSLLAGFFWHSPIGIKGCCPATAREGKRVCGHYCCAHGGVLAPHCPALLSPWQKGVGLPPYCLSLTFRVWPYYCLKSVIPDSPLGLSCNHPGRKPEGCLHIVLVGGNIGSLWPRTPWERAPHCLLEGMKVPAPHLAFSDTTLARGSRRYTSFLPGGVPVYTPTCPVPMGWGDSKASFFTSSCLPGILSKSVYLLGSPIWLHRTGFISSLPWLFQHQVQNMWYKKKIQATHHYVSSGPWASDTACLLSTFQIFLTFVWYKCPRLLAINSRRNRKSTSSFLFIVT